jgi:cytoskeletal protein CcmA (bactofilin family)
LNIRKNKYSKIYLFKLEAGALQYAIFISVLIALLVSAFMSLTYLQNHFKSKVSLYKNAVQNTDRGFSYAFKNAIPYNKKSKFNWNENENSIIQLEKLHWGIFDLIKVKSKENNEVFQKAALVGGSVKNRIAIYMPDHSRSLVVVGNTQLIGNSFLPRSGVKRGNISGHSYTGSELLYGSIRQSGNNLPKIKNLNYLKNLQQILYENDSLEYIDLFEQQKVVNSFFKPTRIFKQNSAIYLDHIQLTGNFIVQSDTLIRIDKTAKLKDIILIAPKIEVDDFVHGNFQAIVSLKLTLGNNIKLSYPSSLVLFQNTINSSEKKEKSQIKIGSNSEIRGLVYSISEGNSSTYDAQIFIEENAVVIGEVYCYKNIELKGEVIGSVYTNGFVAHQNGSVYQNHIYNGKINANDLPVQFCGLAFEGSTSNIAQWLY